MDQNEGAVSSDKFLHIPYQQRWEFHKPTIIRLYNEEKHKMKRLVDRMKSEYEFVAEEHQYKYHLKKWDAKKRTTVDEKAAVVAVLGKRSRASTDAITMINSDGSLSRGVDKKQLKRYLQDQIRHEQQLTLSPGIFMRSNLPYDALVNSRAQTEDFSSPFGRGPPTPSYLMIASPGETSSPGASRPDPSPTIQLVQRKLSLSRSKLFLTGHLESLLNQVVPDDRRLITNYLHDFWIHRFMTMKYWGKGPEIWDTAMIAFKTLGPLDARSSSAAENGIIASPQQTIATHYPMIAPPTQLCRWSIHVADFDYERIPSPEPQSSENEEYNIEDESTWPEWQGEVNNRSLADSMINALKSSVFTDISAQELPMSALAISKTAEISPMQLEVDALAFAIMAGNRDKVCHVLKNKAKCRNQEFWVAFSSIYPLHLAISSMNGASDCCVIFLEVAFHLHAHSTLEVTINDAGFTILDYFLLNILRSHTLVTPQYVSRHFAHEGRFPGEERDICGRWDADSPCMRRLLLSGVHRALPEWKHVFCHTSVQAICHGILGVVEETQVSYSTARSLWDQSALFGRHCRKCSQKLEPGLLHSLVLVAFQLGENGLPGETLFGALAILVALLIAGFSPLLRVELSVTALMSDSDSEDCDHMRMDASELADYITRNFSTSWPDVAKRGWEVFSKVLHHTKQAEQERGERRVREHDEEDENASINGEIEQVPSSDEYLEECKYCQSEDCWKSKSKHIWTIWNVVQIEFLTYRRLSETDPWLSSNFKMQAIADWLDRKTSNLEMPYLTEGKVLPAVVGSCPLEKKGRPLADEICAQYCMNMEDWGRSSFIPY